MFDVSAGCIARPRASQFRDKEPHPRELSWHGQHGWALALLGPPGGLGEAAGGSKWEPLLPSKQALAASQHENLGRGEAQQIGVPNKSHNADLCSGPCSSWGTGRKKRS